MQLRDPPPKVMDSSASQSAEEECCPVLLVSLGNPLLDMTAVVADTSLHQQYGLPTDGQLEVNKPQQSLFELVSQQFVVQYSAGGCALNSSRVFSWMLTERGRAVFVGGIGQDEQAVRLTDIIRDSGVDTRLFVVPDKATGKCVALVLGAERCLCADIGAANDCPPQHLFPPYSNSDGETVPRPLPVLMTAPLLYVEGYFITHSFNTALQIAKFARDKNKTLVFNLCGSYVCENHPKELAQLLPYVDILFGFVEEYKTLERFVDLKSLEAQHSDSIVSCLPRIMEAVHDPAQRRASPDEETSLCVGMEACSMAPDSTLSNGSSANGSPDSSNSHYFDKSDVLAEEESKVDASRAVPSVVGLVVPPTSNHRVVRTPSDITEEEQNAASRLSKHKQGEKEDWARENGSNSLNSDGNGKEACESSNRKDSNGTGACKSTYGKDESYGTLGTNKCAVGDNVSVNSWPRKVVILTQGPLPLLFVHDSGPVQQKVVQPLPLDSIVDTTGAGDSFVGGFLAALTRGHCLEDCIDGGMYAARNILQQKGCTLPNYSATFL